MTESVRHCEERELPRCRVGLIDVRYASIATKSLHRGNRRVAHHRTHALQKRSTAKDAVTNRKGGRDKEKRCIGLAFAKT